MKKIYYLLSFLLLAACGNGLTEKVVSTFEGDIPAVVRYYDKDDHCVREVHYNENGTIYMEGGMDGNLREGAWTSYFPDGKVQSSGFFKNDKREGEAKIYHENGNLYIEGFYHDGIKCGTWVTYDEQGYEMQRIDYGTCD